MQQALALEGVFPTHVGVFPGHGGWRCTPLRLPHARGGVSAGPLAGTGVELSSPRTWGCFRQRHAGRGRSGVFPTHVGVFPLLCLFCVDVFRLPHARGGVSAPQDGQAFCVRSSPRTWGCFCRSGFAHRTHQVFPTHVGVFLKRHACGRYSWRLPHARGGVSIRLGSAKASMASSPRTWGCFPVTFDWIGQSGVFPTHVGVFLRRRRPVTRAASLPHARGGVSVRGAFLVQLLSSSPRTWGCFSITSTPSSVGSVFPTHVGVFLERIVTTGGAIRLPHARGGVSAPPACRAPPARSSPRTWGCFPVTCAAPDSVAVFPTHVGVFPALPKLYWKPGRLPHARGGVS